MKKGIRKWYIYFNQLNGYLPYLTWWAGQLQLDWPREFNKLEKKEVLNNIMTKPQEEKLQENGWDILEQDFANSILELEKYKPQIICEFQATSKRKEMQQKIDALSSTPKRKTGKHKHSKSNGGNSDGSTNNNGHTTNSGTRKKCTI